ncbi:MAG: hypothetical protein COC10_09345 [Sphingobium sp.]|jgi:hypothetical protein|nr:MAG: hypothetical protein COC10_09345 [Sphingobium sp.]
MHDGLTCEEAAIIAAAQATEATGELLRFIREGAYSERSAFDVEVVGKLAESLKLALDIEGEPGSGSYLDDEEKALLANLRASVANFLEGWVG